MRSVAGLSTAETVKKYETLVGSESHGEFYNNTGKFLPLSVYKAQGFDEEAIKAHSKPENIKQHAVFGTVYRVPIMETGNRGDRTMCRSSHVKAKGKQLSLSSEPAEGLLAIEDGAADSASSKSHSSSDSSSSSTSSSSKGKKGKKNKKHKKSKKDKKDKKGKKSKKSKKNTKDKGKKRNRDQEWSECTC